MADETLKITGGNAAGQDITLEQELVIGRSTPGLGSLGGDSEISRVHARVFHDPSGRLMIEDLGSTNGTFVNGNRISGQQALNPGDQVRVGQTSMSVEGGGAAGATTVGNVVPAPAPVPTPAPEPPTQALPPQQPAYAQQPPQQPPYGGGPVGGPPERSGGGPSRGLLAAIGLAAAVVAAVVVVLLLSGGDDDKKTQTTAQTTPTTQSQTTPSVAMPEPPTETTPSEKPSSGYPPGFRKKFVDSCESGGAPRSVCGCTFDKLKSRYTFPEFVSLLGKVKGSNLPGPVRDAVRQCVNS